MLVTLNDVLVRAKQEKYAVGLFNTVNLELAQGVIAAAEETRSPVIIGTAEVLLPSASLDDLAPMLLSFAKRATVPVVVHFDHGLTEEKIYHAIDLGFSSIMYDCSTCGYEENIEKVRAMTQYAHSKGVSVEAELGHVGDNDGSAEAADQSNDSIYTDPKQAYEYATATGVDALAVAIGTAHGAYKSTPKLDFDRLKTIANTVEIPLVLHGGSGLSDDDFRKSVANGISKVNIFTDINTALAKATHDNYRDGLGQCELMPTLANVVKNETIKKMKLFGCTGKY